MIFRRIKRLARILFVLCVLTYIATPIISTAGGPLGGMPKDELKEALKKYHTDKVKKCDSETELINYAYQNFVKSRTGIIVAYSGEINGIGYEDLTDAELTLIVQKVIAINHPTILEDGIGLWGNIESINKGMMKFSDFTLVCISLNYRNSKEEMQRLNEYYRDCIREIYKGYDSKYVSDFMKSKLIHDFICENFDYDQSHTNYDDYSAVFKPIQDKNVMVCQGYCLMTYKLLALSGIESKIVISEDESHSWNIVKLDGNWYQLDVTNDDTGYFNGIYDYKYFLRAKAEEEARCTPAASSLLYEDISGLDYADSDYDASLNNLFSMDPFLYSFIFRFLASKEVFVYTLNFIILLAVITILFIYVRKRIRKERLKKNRKYEEYNSI